MTAGATKRADCVIIIPMKPALVSPVSLITPISNVFVSTEIRSKE